MTKSTNFYLHHGKHWLVYNVVNLAEVVVYTIYYAIVITAVMAFWAVLHPILPLIPAYKRLV